ncbi:MAG: hypothetical protein HGA22_10365, partial [Clostridiales bacterium]|nr:hypothetical protein [Clostridiales bacterium]
MKHAGYSVYTVNLEFHDDTFATLSELIVKNKIDVICTGGLSFDCAKVAEVFRIARTVKPGIVTLAGGGIISSDPLPAMKVLEADIGIVGEGEVTICEVASVLERGMSLRDVRGVVYR